MFSSYGFKGNTKVKLFLLTTLVMSMLLMNVALAADLSQATVTLYEDAGLTRQVTANSYTYDGLEKRPYVKAVVGGTTLTSNDYNVVYHNNINANNMLPEVIDNSTGIEVYSGRAYVELTPKGSNTGTFKYAPYIINQLDLETANIECTVTGTKMYDGRVTRPKITTSNLVLSNGSRVDLGWTAFNFDGTDIIDYYDEANDRVIKVYGPECNLLDVGSYYIDIYGSNYSSVYRTWVHVFPAVLSCTWNPNTFVYDGNSHVPTPTISTGVSGQVVTSITTTGSQINVGNNYPAKATPDGVRDNNGVYSSFDFTKLGFADLQAYYTYAGYSSLEEFIVDYDYIVPTDVYTASGYTTLMNNYHNTFDETTSPSLLVYLWNAGIIGPDDSGYLNTSFDTLFNITPRQINVKANDKSCNTGDPMPTFDLGTPTGAVSGQTPAFSGSLVSTAANTNTAGTFDINQGSVALADNGTFLANNYSLNFTKGTLTINAVDKQITAPDVSDPVDKVYKGSAWVQDPVVTVDGTVLTKDTHYTVTYSPNIDVGTVTITIEAIPGSGYTGTVTKTFQITPARLILTWNDKRVFQYDGTPHLRTGVVTVDPTTPTGETPTCTITGEQVNVGTDYVATAGNFAITDGQRKISNYTLPTNLTATFDIVTLPIDEEKPTDDPTKPDDPTPIDPQDPDYTVEIVIEWPNTEYTYNGDHQGPKPTKVQMVIKDSNGDPVGTPVDLVEGTDYDLVYANDVDAAVANGTTGPNVLVRGKGGNISGDSPVHPYTIKPAVIKVKADNKTKVQGEANPELTKTETQGPVNNETAAYTGALACAATTATTVAESPVAITQGTLALTNGTGFKASNYTLEFTPGELTITAPAEKQITAPDVSDPEDKVYKGSEWTQDPVVTVDGTVLTKGTHYTVTYSPNIDVGTVTITIEAIPGSGYTTPTPIQKTFQITPARLILTWNDKRVFQYDGTPHLRTGVVTVDPETPTGETPTCTITGEQVNVGTDYVATAGNFAITDGQRKISNYTLPTNLTATFDIVTLPIDEEKPTDDPTKPDDPTPIDPQDPDYTVEVVIEWPTEEYTYNGQEQGPEPTVTLVIKDSTGEVVEQKPLVKDVDYNLDYDNNVHAGEGTVPDSPQVVVVGKGQITGNSDPHYYVIKPAEIIVKIQDEHIVVGQEPTLEGYSEVQGPVNGETACYAGEFSCTGNGLSEGVFPITQGSFELTDGTNFQESDYTLTVLPGNLYVGPAPFEPKRIIDVSYPEDRIYTGYPIEQDLDVTDSDGVLLQKDIDYTVSYEDNINVGTAYMTIMGIGDYEGIFNRQFEILPAQITIEWSSIYQFYYDGQKHIRIGTVRGSIDGETIDYTLEESKIEVGNYIATITITGVTGGQGRVSNYEISPTAQYTNDFEIIPLPVSTPEPTYEPDDNPSSDPTPGYTVEVVIEWPDDTYTYDGTEKEPVPTVKMVIKDPTGAVIEETPLVEGTDYTLDYDNNIDAGDKTDPNAPQVVVVGEGPNYTGTSTPHKFTIEPAVIKVTADNKTKQEGEANPELTYTETQGAVHGETAAYTGAITTTATATTPASESPVPITQGNLALTDGDMGTQGTAFKASNYVLEFTNGSLTITAGPATKEITDPDVSDPEDKVYKGSEWTQDPVVTVDGTVLTKDEDYTVTYSPNIDVGTVTITITGIGDYTGTVTKTFQITPAPLTVNWSDIYQFQYDGQNHIRKGTVTGGVNGETIEFTLAENKIPVGNYTATITITGVTGGQGKLSNYTLPTADELTRPFEITSLPITTPEDTYEPEDDPADNPEEDPTPGYTVEVVIEWPDDPYTYDGTEKEPEPEVKLVIKDPTGAVVEEKPLVKDEDYTLDYDNNIDAGEDTDPDAPQVVVVGDGTNITGTTPPHKFTIEPAVIKVTADNKTKQEGQANPELTYTETQGAVHGETAAYEGLLECAAMVTTPVADSPVPITQGTLALIDGAMGTQGTAFKASNYTLEFTEGELTITALPPATKVITDPDVSDPEDKVYKGSEWTQDPVVTVDGTVLTKDEDYTVTYSPNIDVGTVTITITGIGEYSGTVTKTFQITPAPLTVNWSNIYQFQYDGQNHIRKGTVTGGVNGETITFTLAENKIPVGNYDATITITGVEGGQGKLSNYTLPAAEELTRPFEITPLPITTPEDTYEPEDDPADNPEEDPTPGYTVEVVIEWPDDPYTYDGTEKEPEPEVKLVIKDPTGAVVEEKPLVKDEDYTLDYDNNIDAGEDTDPDAPQVVVVGDGTNITGTTPPHKFTIEPAVIKVTADNKTKQEGQANPELTYTETQGAVHGETAAYTGAITTTATATTPASESPVPITQGNLALTDGDMGTQGTAFKASNYVLEFVDGNLIITLPDVPTKEITDLDVTDPEDKEYKGSEWIQDPTVTVDGETLTKDVDYTVTYTENIDVGTATITITGIGYYTGVVTKTFQITPVPLTVDWSDKDTFQFDGQYHVRKGTVVSPITGDVVEYTLTGKQKDVGEGYEAVITITKVTRADGTESPISNYVAPDPADLTAEFKIVTLPLPDEKPTVEPEDNPEDDPATDPDEGYTVEVVVTWPDKEYDYDGGEKKPTPEKVELIIKDPEGNPVGEPIPLVEGTDYELVYEENVDVGDKDDPQPPTVTIKAIDGGNFEGEVDNPFTIKPAKLVVKADNKSKKKGKENPELTYKVTGAKNGEEPAFDGELETTCETDSPVGKYPIYCDGKLTAKDNGSFKIANYDIQYIDGTLTVKSTSGPAAPSEPNDKIVELGVDLRSGSPDPDKGNKNHYKIVEEEVIYWVDYINGGDDIGNTVNLVLNIPLDFDILDSDGGTVDKVNRKITWKFKDGLKHNEGGTKEVHLKYTKFSKSGITSEDIYPLATIAVLSDIKDKSAVHNIVYTDGTPVEIEHKVYMWGDQDTPTFRPTDYISRAEGAMVLLRIFDIDYQATEVKGDEFPDLGETYEQAQKAIVKATELGLINGYEDGTYRPNRSMTRGEFMKLIAVYVEYKAKQDGIEGIDLDDTKTVTKYAAQNNWANKYVTLLNRLNLTPISEENPDLDIEGKITRAEVAQLCNLYLMRAPVYDDGRIELPFEDVDKDTEHWGDIVEATRPSHEEYDLTEDAFEVWDYDDWKKAYDEGFTNKYLY